MSILGNLAVNLISNTAGFVKGFGKAKREAKSFGDTVRRDLAPMLAGVLGAQAIKSFVGGQLTMIDALGKSSRQLGLSTEALGAYHHAAQLSGLTTDSLETALAKMQDSIGDAILNPNGGAVRAFKELGVSAAELSKAEDPLALIQKHIQGIGNQNKKLAIVRDIFGRGGAEVLNLFEQNLAGVRKEYEGLGLAVSAEEAKRIEDLNDSMFELGEKFKGIGRRMLIDASPDLVEAVRGLNTILEQTGIVRPAGAGAPTTGREAFGAGARSALRPTGPSSGVGLLGLAGAALEGRFTEALFEPVRRVIIVNEESAGL